MAALRGGLTLAYPLVIYAALRVWSPRAVATCVLLLLAIRGVTARVPTTIEALRALAVPVLPCVAIAAISWISNDRLWILLAPVLTSVALLIGFARSLRARECIVETLARIQVGSLTPDEIRYCRQVTRIWCGFFAFNALAAWYVASFETLEVWTLYNGFLAYLLIGLLFAAEYTFRQWRFRRYVGSPLDFVFRRVFPPRSG